MKTITLQGKEYVQVSERLKYFRENFKEGRIDTSYQIIENRVIFNAKVYDGDKLLSSGTGMKNTAKEFELEKAETRAIGRALAIAGIGLDAGIASYDEMADFYNDNKKPETNSEQLTDKQKSTIVNFMTEGKIHANDLIERYETDKVDELSKAQASELIGYVYNLTGGGK
jgi:hypothetical protein